MVAALYEQTVPSCGQVQPRLERKEPSLVKPTFQLSFLSRLETRQLGTPFSMADQIAPSVPSSTSSLSAEQVIWIAQQ